MMVPGSPSMPESRKGFWSMRHAGIRLKWLAMTVLASGLPLGAPGPLVSAQDGQTGISSPFAERSDASGLPFSAGDDLSNADKPSATVHTLASALIAAWDTDQDRSLSSYELARAARCFFERADTKPDNRLAVEELLGALSRLLPDATIESPDAASQERPASRRRGIQTRAYLVEGFVETADVDGDNEISSSEWAQATQRSFHAWDSNVDSRLDEGELEQALLAFLPFLNPPSGGASLRVDSR
jgi:hypothetical protein